MADVNLIEWATNQPNWVRDALRRIATTTEFIVGDEDRAAILARIKHAASGTGTSPDCEPITPEHLSQCADIGPRAVLASIGPLQNIDRLAKDQQLRFAPRGVTLIFGENGSGKSGYARIAKRLCRSLSIDELKGDVFKAKPNGPMQVKLRFQLGDAAITELDWAPDTKPPGALKQISVFDSRNARLYVDQQNRIAYLPVEIAVLEHHGQLCGAFGTAFTIQQTTIEKRLKTPLPAGYTPAGTMQKLLAQLEAKSQTLPKKAELEKLAGLSEAELEELRALERKLAQDPVAQAATRRRAVQILTRLNDVLKTLEEGLSDEVAKQLASLAQNASTTAAAAVLAANQQFAAEPLKLVGGDAWRLLYEAARDFAALSGGPVDRISDQVGTPCPLCQEPLVDKAAKRIARFNAFVQSEAAKRSDAARDALGKARETLETLTAPPTDVVTGTLTAYAGLDTPRADLLVRIEATLTAYTARRSSLLASIASADQKLAPLPSSLRSTLSADVEKLGAEAIQLEARSYRRKLVTAGIGKAAYRGGA
jgi:energy-coupling factor transporter ATP-binding protein EcfA2